MFITSLYLISSRLRQNKNIIFSLVNYVNYPVDDIKRDVILCREGDYSLRVPSRWRQTNDTNKKQLHGGCRGSRGKSAEYIRANAAFDCEC